MTVRVAYVTTNRSEYGPVYWLLRDLVDDPRFSLHLVVAGAHGGPAQTVREIESDGLPIAARLPYVEDVVIASAALLRDVADALVEAKPDVLVVYGDRWELLPIANAALLTSTPVVHLCGGDITEGAIDDQVRHAVTKLAHLHFATSARSAARIRQMGEEAWRVHDVGDPAVDRFRRGPAASSEELRELLGFVPNRNTLLVTVHPPTLSLDSVRAESVALATALQSRGEPVVITAPAPDPGHEIVREVMQDLARTRPATTFVESLGSYRYRGLLGVIGAMVGNSSSGLVEAPCVSLPTVNIGDRQAGRDRGENVIDVEGDAAAISAAIDRALSPEFRATLTGRSPYGDGHSVARIIAALATLPERDRLLRKRFTMMEPTQ
jgi:UDP-hydrolysing UDP-N-acetyl-D-glucosamine 2-epimerase